MNLKYLSEHFEKIEANETRILTNDTFLIVRSNAKNFKGFAKDFEQPFDQVLYDTFQKTMTNVMKKYSFNIVLGYTTSDEFSFLLSSKIERIKERKILSLMSSAITLEFNTLLAKTLNKSLKTPLIFDCRVDAVENIDDVTKYFLWRYKANYLSSLNRILYCYNLKAKEKVDIDILSIEEKIKFIKDNNLDVKDRFKNGYAILYYPNDENEKRKIVKLVPKSEQEIFNLAENSIVLYK